MSNEDIINGYFDFIAKYIVGPFIKEPSPPKAGLGATLLIGLTVIPVIIVSFLILITVWLCL